MSHCSSLLHQHMASESLDIVTWATSELPLIPLPSAEDLNNLTVGPAARDLLQFLTTRVFSLPHAQRARAVLAVAGGSNRVREPDEELNSVKKEIEQVENELHELRAELKKDYGVVCGGGAVAVEDIREAGNTELKYVGEKILEHIEKGIEKAELVGETETVGEEEEEEEWEQRFLNILSELCAAWMHSERDGDQVEQKIKEELKRVGLGRVCEVLLSEVRRNVAEARGWKGEWLEDVVEDVEGVARDTQQRAYKNYEELWKESESLLARIQKEVSGIPGVDMGTLLRAQEEGERAVLQFAKKDAEEESKEVWGKLRREVGRGNERVAEIFRACGEMKMGSCALLNRAWETRKRVIEDVKDLERMKVEGVEGVSRAVEAVIRASEKMNSVELERQIEKSDEEVDTRLEGIEDIDKVRREEAEGVERGVVDVCEDVEKRGSIVEEMWARMMENTETGLLRRVEELMDEAKEVREAEVRYVQEELRNWIKCPGGEAARIVGLVDEKHQKRIQ